jgi:glycosyltransferase involved in cell wall biosynthesis
MKLLFIIHEDSLDGSQKSIYSVINDLPQKYCGIMNTDNVNSKSIIMRKVKYYNYSSLYNLYSPSKIYFGRLIRSLTGIYNIVVKEEYSVLYINSISNIYLILLTPILRNQVKFILHIRERVRGHKTFIVRFISSFFDQVILNSDGEREYYNLKKENCVIIPNIVSISKHKEDYSINGRILYVGQINERKNVTSIVESAIYNSYEYHFYGEIKEQHYFSKIEDIISENNISHRIVFHGYSREIFNNVDSFDMFITLSKVETFNRTVLEAAQAGLPVILSDITPHNKFLEDGIIGTSIKNYSNAEAVSTAIDEVYTNYDELANRCEKYSIPKKYLKSSIINQYDSMVLNHA